MARAGEKRCRGLKSGSGGGAGRVTWSAFSFLVLRYEVLGWKCQCRTAGFLRCISTTGRRTLQTRRGGCGESLVSRTSPATPTLYARASRARLRARARAGGCPRIASLGMLYFRIRVITRRATCPCLRAPSTEHLRNPAAFALVTFPRRRSMACGRKARAAQETISLVPGRGSRIHSQPSRPGYSPTRPSPATAAPQSSRPTARRRSAG